MTKQQFILFESQTSDVATLSKKQEGLASAPGGWICTACNAVKPDAAAIDVVVQGVIQDSPVGFVLYGLGIARREFLYSFGEQVVHRNLLVGQVSLENGNLLKDWVSFHGRHRIVVRRKSNASHRRCEACHQAFYFGLGSPYLYPRPPAGVEMFHANCSDLVVAAEFAEVAVGRKWPGIQVTELPVVDAPKDGLGELE